MYVYVCIVMIYNDVGV